MLRFSDLCFICIQTHVPLFHFLCSKMHTLLEICTLRCQTALRTSNMSASILCAQNVMLSPAPAPQLEHATDDDDESWGSVPAIVANVRSWRWRQMWVEPLCSNSSLFLASFSDHWSSTMEAPSPPAFRRSSYTLDMTSCLRHAVSNQYKPGHGFICMI